MNEKIYCHGDVVLRKIEKLPAKLKIQKGNTLAFGEVTGHHHALVPKGTQLKSYESLPQMKLYKGEDGKSYVEIFDPMDLLHQEHNKIEIDTGIYEVEIVREYDYNSKETRRVVD
jgi:hypothetical protein